MPGITDVLHAPFPPFPFLLLSVAPARQRRTRRPEQALRHRAGREQTVVATAPRRASRRRGFHHHRRGHRQATAEQRPVADHPDHAGVNLVTATAPAASVEQPAKIDIRGMGPGEHPIPVDSEARSARATRCALRRRGKRDSRSYAVRPTGRAHRSIRGPAAAAAAASSAAWAAW
ncbi:hypothetical protein ACPA9J_00825 [Pseudomonas aeruginosa]